MNVYGGTELQSLTPDIICLIRFSSFVIFHLECKTGSHPEDPKNAL
jgi:hypothetical protein